MLPRKKWNQFGKDGLVVKGIVIHNAGNELTAQENYIYLLQTTNSNGCHFIVDDKEVIQCLPKTWKAWTTGKGEDWCFNNCLSIEICNTKSNWSASQTRAINLIKEWMEEYQLNETDIFFHQDFNEKVYCPNKILDEYKTKTNWLEREF